MAVYAEYRVYWHSNTKLCLTNVVENLDKCHKNTKIINTNLRTVTIEQWAIIWVLPVYVELIRAFWVDDGDRPLLFWQNEKLFKLSSKSENQLFALTKLNIYKTNCLNLSNRTRRSAEKGASNKKSMKLLKFVKAFLNIFLNYLKKLKVLNSYQIHIF
jgi:hypothetical protein